MTATRGLALFRTVAVAAALRAAGPDATATSPRLKSISARVGAKGASLTIEASEPVGYSLTRPDPVTVLVDFRNVTMVNVANTVVADAKSPIANVSVEPYESLGAAASRVRIVLAQPVAHRVRSERNTVIVEFEKASGKAAPYVMPPASGQSQVTSRQSQVSPQSDPPDAMLALQAPSQRALDPIEALRLAAPSGAPQAAPTQAPAAVVTP